MTPHIGANKGDIARTVIMPGDPLRAKYIADTYLKDVKLVSDVRNIYAFTGIYEGKEVTVMASGMGMPSMGIYSYELYSAYDVETIIRIGSCGAYTDKLDLYDIIVADGCYSKSSYAKEQSGNTDEVMYADSCINETIRATAHQNNIHTVSGMVYSSDVFYYDIAFDFKNLCESKGCLAVEMESFALFHNANQLGKKASCVLTVSDNLVTKEATTSLERQNSFTKMMELVLKSIL